MQNTINEKEMPNDIINLDDNSFWKDMEEILGTEPNQFINDLDQTDKPIFSPHISFGKFTYSSQTISFKDNTIPPNTQ